jgi:hypothetical protein
MNKKCVLSKILVHIYKLIKFCAVKHGRITGIMLSYRGYYLKCNPNDNCVLWYRNEKSEAVASMLWISSTFLITQADITQDHRMLLHQVC